MAVLVELVGASQKPGPLELLSVLCSSNTEVWREGQTIRSVLAVAQLLPRSSWKLLFGAAVAGPESPFPFCLAHQHIPSALQEPAGPHSPFL